jgi:hypothetical protein
METMTLARPAVILNAHTITLVRRRNLLKALITRCEKLLKNIEEKLWPMVELELDGEKKATVQVCETLLELSRSDKTSPLYKQIAENYLDKETLVSAKEDPQNRTEYSVFGAKLVGRATSVEHLLKNA